MTRLPDHALTLGMIRYVRGLGVNTDAIIKGGKKDNSALIQRELPRCFFVTDTVIQWLTNPSNNGTIAKNTVKGRMS